MRIAMVAFPGVEYTIELSEGLAEFEDVLLMLPKPQAVRFEDIIKKHVKVYPFYFPRMRYPTNLLMAYDVVRKINEFKPDIVHLQRGNPWFNVAALPFLNRYCLVTTIHDVILLDFPSQRIPRFTYKPAVEKANQLIVHGERLKKAMVRMHERRTEDVHVLPRGVNSIYTRYIEKPCEDDGRTVLFFGRIWEYKGLKYLIEAEPMIRDSVPDAKIVIAGVGEDFGRYEAMIVNRDGFEIHNKFIPHTMVAELFQKASIVVLPYVDGSQSGVIPMAYSFKKPVVVTDVGSLPENVDEGITGCVVPPKSSSQLGAAIIDLLLDDEKRVAMGQNAYRKTKEELCWKNIAKRTIEVYRRALSLR